MVLKECSKCMVYTPQGENFAGARVVLSPKCIFLYFDLYSMHEAKFKARVNFFDTQIGLVRTICYISVYRNPKYPEMPEPWMGDCKILEVMKVLQRQKDVRVRTFIEVLLTSKQGSFYGMIENLSAGGAYVTTLQGLDRNELMSFDYSFHTMKHRYEMVAIRAKQLEDGRYGYGCQFVNLTDKAKAALCHYVYQKTKKKKHET